MKRETMLLKFAVILIAVPVLVLSGFLLPAIARDASMSSPQMAWVLRGIMAVIVASILPFLAALYQAFRLLGYIDTSEAFSDLSVTALKNIKRFAFAISLLYTLALPLFFIVGEVDDAPGVILMAASLIFAPFIIGVFAAVLQKLLQKAIDIKRDNDLTI